MMEADENEYVLDAYRAKFPMVGRYTQIGLHATGGIGDHRQVTRTLLARRLGVHFVCDANGDWVQILNLKNRGAHIAGLNDLAVGIEFVSPLFAGALAERELGKGVSRLEYKATVGRRTVSYVGLTTAQMESALHFIPKMCNDLGIPKNVPCNKDGTLRRTSFSTLPEARAFSGVLGHFHWHPNKHDPGFDIMERLHKEFRGK